MEERTTYAVDKDITDRDEAVRACANILEVLRPVLRFAVIDLYSDYDSEMPSQVADVAQQLRQ